MPDTDWILMCWFLTPAILQDVEGNNSINTAQAVEGRGLQRKQWWGFTQNLLAFKEMAGDGFFYTNFIWA